MSTDDIILSVINICKENKVEHLSLFGSYAKGTETKYSDIDFVAYGVTDYLKLKEEIDDIPTLKKIDIFDYDATVNEYLIEDMDKYGKELY